MNIQEQRRAAFEDWYVTSALANCPELTEDHARNAVKHYRGDGDYAESSSLRDAWWGWNAALDSVVIELPAEPALAISAEESLDMEPEDFEAMEVSHGLQCMMLRKCRTAIEAAGLKVSP